jgi:flagellar biosynthesis chaperone FliJ
MDELLSRQKEVDEARFELQGAREKLKSQELNLTQLIGKTK